MSNRNLVHNERTKLWSTFWSNVGVAAVVAGVIVPSLSGEPSVTKYLLGLGTGLAIGACCVAIAHLQLGYLKDD
jgi:hypothetical protein